MKKRNLIFAVLRVIIALSIAGIISQIRLDYVEAFLYDMRVRLKPAPSVSGEILTVTIDSKTLEELKRRPDAQDHTRFFSKLGKSNPRAVLYIDDMENIIGSYEELETLSKVLYPMNFFAVEDTKLPEEGVENQFVLLPPLQDIQVRSAPTVIDNNQFAKDGVARRMILEFNGRHLLHMNIASLFNGVTDAQKYRGAFAHKNSVQAYISFRPTGTYKPVSFIDVLTDRVDKNLFNEKIVVIGRTSNQTTKDYVATPFSRDAAAMSRVELHANMLDTLITRNIPVRSPSWLDFIATGIIAILTVFIVMTVRPAQGLYLLFVAMFTYSAICYIFFLAAGLWLNLAHPLLTIFICYYFFIPYRLIIENRRSWEYYHKHALITQVEELKSNFLRMMSHDLKTPIARIQGMAESLERESKDATPEQKDAIRTIGTSARELKDFVGSILSLSRIESKDVKLHLKSRDINAVLKDIVQKCDYLAKEKNIRLITEFEPMFSMKFDEDLMRQVFTNLIENAVKYSPENSSVLITTEEAENKVLVQVADQGIGVPKEDMENLFSKFYRAKGVRESEIKGSGLGLYLSKYFVDLHQGDITVESEPGKGSTFSVELPTAT